MDLLVSQCQGFLVEGVEELSTSFLMQEVMKQGVMNGVSGKLREINIEGQKRLCGMRGGERGLNWRYV